MQSNAYNKSLPRQIHNSSLISKRLFIQSIRYTDSACPSFKHKHGANHAKQGAVFKLE